VKSYMLLLGGALAVSALVAMACSKGSAPAPRATSVPTVAAPAPVTVSAATHPSEFFRFDPNTYRVKAGAPVTITFKNQNALNHTFTVADLGINLEVAKQGDSVSKQFTFSKAGTFDLMCAVPGHKEGGMVGKFTVEQ